MPCYETTTLFEWWNPTIHLPSSKNNVLPIIHIPSLFSNPRMSSLHTPRTSPPPGSVFSASGYISYAIGEWPWLAMATNKPYGYIYPTDQIRGWGWRVRVANQPANVDDDWLFWALLCPRWIWGSYLSTRRRYAAPMIIFNQILPTGHQLTSPPKEHSIHSYRVGSGFTTWHYRVTLQVVSNIPLTSKQKLCFSMRPMYLNATLV